MTYINLHLSVEAIVEQKVVGHADSVGFHGMTLTIVVIPNITWNNTPQRLFHLNAHETERNDLKLLYKTDDLAI